MEKNTSLTSRTIQTRLPEFDLLRSLAIIGVIIIHITAPLEMYAHNGPFMYYLFAIIHLAQRFCVPAFLIISGFFLTYKNDNEQKPTLVLKRRLLRIIPPYLFWSLFFYFLDVTLGKRPFNVNLLLQNLLMGSAVGAYYFVVLIIQFYVLWWLLTKFKILNYKKLLLISLIVQVIVTAYLYFCLFSIQYFPAINLMYRLILPWSFYFVLGLFLGNNYEMTKRVIQKQRWVLIIITAVSLLLSVIEFNLIDGSNLLNNINNPKNFTGEQLETAISYWRISSQVYSVAFFLLIIGWYDTKFIKFGLTNLLKKFSEYSFAIYLIHQPIIWKVIFRVFKLLGTGSLASFLVIFALDLGICYGLIYLGCKFLPKSYRRYILGL
jgi:peptidoglycan/LPS O-acetylase OafA/YrhL